MATQTSTVNPFAAWGSIVRDDRFIGRKDEVQKIEGRVFDKANYGNLSIVGLPRVGKSSLAYHAIMDRQDELVSERNTIPVYFDVSSIKDSNKFFVEMVVRLDDELRSIEDKIERWDVYDRQSESIIESLRQECDSYQIQRFFRLVKRIGYKPIFILDEFDTFGKERGIFSLADFQLLRELSQDPKTQVCLVTCSRQRIEDIEARDGTNSNFFAIFDNIRLGMFTDDDVREYWDHFRPVWDPGDDYRRQLKYYVGNHPCLMNFVNGEMYGKTAGQRNFDAVKLDLMNRFDYMIDTLEREDLRDAAIQLVIGPLFDVNQTDVEKLLQYEFIRKVTPEYKRNLFGGMEIGPTWDGASYVCFSDYCTLDFYRRYFLNVPYFPLWSQTENLLRDAIMRYLAISFSDDAWDVELEQELQFDPPFKDFSINMWRENMKELKNNREKTLKNFPDLDGSNLLKFASTGQIFEMFIKPKWAWFGKNIFKGSRKEWLDKFDFLSQFRNVALHTNADIFNVEGVNDKVVSYCKDIIYAINAWKATFV